MKKLEIFLLLNIILYNINALASMECDDTPREEVKMYNSYQNLLDYFDKNHAHYRVVEHAAEGRCEDVSNIRGSTLEQSAKAIVVSARITKKKRNYYLLALKATQKVNFDAVTRLVGARSVNMAQAEKAEELTGCVMGSIPPFSFHSDLKLIIDPALLDQSLGEIAFNAGRLDRSVFLAAEDYSRLVEDATVKKISE